MTWASSANGTQVSISPVLRFYAAVEGIIDGKVLLSTGDGASAVMTVGPRLENHFVAMPNLKV
jgi:hypothetical protein